MAKFETKVKELEELLNQEKQNGLDKEQKNEEERKSLLDQIKQLEKLPASEEPKVDKDDTKVKDLEAKIAELQTSVQKQLQDADASKAESLKLKTELDALKDENDSLTKKLSEATQAAKSASEN